jgi:hypothetical protein
MTGNKYVTTLNYSFAVNGGAKGIYEIGSLVPAGAVITKLFVDVDTTVKSDGLATLQVKVGSTAVSDATAIAIWVDGIIDLAGSADFVKIGTQDNLAITIADATLTDGVFRVIVEYFIAS